MRYPLLAVALIRSGLAQQEDYYSAPSELPAPVRQPSKPVIRDSRTTEFDRPKGWKLPKELLRFIGKSDLSRRKVELWHRQSGLCFWCGRLTELTLPAPKLRGFPNMATLDHLRSRLHPGRREPPKPGEERYVMACDACNRRRGREEVKALGLQELHRRSGRAPA